jgi:hypothetical protein
MLLASRMPAYMELLVWKSDLPMLSKFVCYRFLLWSRSRLSTTHAAWERWWTRSRKYLLHSALSKAHRNAFYSLIFPRWDVISIILSIFLLTYTYIEARSNYHRGSILVLSYLVLAAGFYFAPSTSPEDPGLGAFGNAVQAYSRVFETGLSMPQVVWRTLTGS